MPSNDNDTSNIYAASVKYVADSLSSYEKIIAGIISAEITSQSALIALDRVNQTFSRLTSSIESMYNFLDVTEIRNVFEQCTRRIENLTSSSLNFSSLTDNITIEQDSVTLSDDAVETLTNFFDKTEDSAPAKVKSKMSLEAFLTGILIPIILFIFQLCSDKYQERANAIESQKYQVQENAYQEQLIDITYQQLEEARLHTQEEQKQSEYLKQIIDILSSLEVPPEVPSTTSSVPVEPSSAPDISEESLPDSDTVLDEPDDSDSSE